MNAKSLTAILFTGALAASCAGSGTSDNTSSGDPGTVDAGSSGNASGSASISSSSSSTGGMSGSASMSASVSSSSASASTASGTSASSGDPASSSSASASSSAVTGSSSDSDASTSASVASSTSSADVTSSSAAASSSSSSSSGAPSEAHLTCQKSADDTMGGLHGYLDEDTCTVGGPPYIGTTPYAHSCDAAPIMVHLEPPASASPKRLYMEDMVTMVADQTVMYNPVHAVDLTGCWQNSTTHEQFVVSRITNVAQLPYGQWKAVSQNGSLPALQIDGFTVHNLTSNGTFGLQGTISANGQSLTFTVGETSTWTKTGPGSC